MKRRILTRKTIILQLLVFIITGVVVFLISSWYDVYEEAHIFIENHESYNLDEFLVVVFFWMLFLLALVVYRTRLLYIRNIEVTKLSTDLEQQIKAKDQLQSIIAHDLKAPFNALIGLSDLMLKKHDELESEKRSGILSMINHTSRSTYDLLENLLDWSRLQSGKLKPSYKKIELSDLAESVIDILGTIAANKNISIEPVIPRGVKIRVDENMMRTVIRNLLSNAIKYSHKGGTINITAVVNKNFVEVHVSDTGIGLTSSQIEGLFLETTESTPGTENENGTGLGLRICKEFVEMNGGEIWVTSEENKGANFIFTLPLDA